MNTADRVRYDERIRMQISRLRPPLEGAQRPMRPRDERALANIVTESSRRARPAAVLIIGSVGAGKTTFLNYTRHVAARSFFATSDRKPLWLYVDFRDRMKEMPAVKFICRKLLDHISESPFLSDYTACTQHAYKKQIAALTRGVLPLLPADERNRRIADLIVKDYEEVQPFVEKILSYASQNVPAFLVIDNVDQFEEPSAQEEIFRDVMALSRNLGCNLVISLREATYVKSRSLPVFDAFDFDPIQIDPPVVEAVLAKRFFAAKELMKGKPVSFDAENGAHMKLEDGSVIIDLLQATVLGTEVGNLLDVMATSDIRLALRLTREFLQYGYAATGKALRVYQMTGKYTLPQHEAMRAMLLGNQAVYSEKYSVVINPLDSRLGISRAQLLRLFVLTAVVNYGTSKSFEQIAGQDIRKAVVSIGFGEELALRVLQDLCAGRFLLTTTHGPASFNSGFIPTRLGGYVVRRLLSDMMFLENIMMDTFIADHLVWEDLRAAVQDVYAQKDIVTRVGLRRKAIAIFFEYMKSCYAVLHQEALRRGLPQEWCTDPLEFAEATLHRNLDRAAESAWFNYGPERRRGA